MNQTSWRWFIIHDLFFSSQQFYELDMSILFPFTEIEITPGNVKQLNLDM